jgi:NAD(P)H-hydrate epimerase
MQGKTAMLKILFVDDVRAVEAFADQNGIPYAELMERAGRVVAARAADYLATLPAEDPRRVTVLVGGGNNGGDGLVAGRVLAQEMGAQVRFYLTSKRDESDPVFKAVLEGGLFVAFGEDDLRYRTLHQMVASASLVIDALYGIGGKPPLRPEAVKLLRAIRAALREPAPPPRLITPDVLPPAPLRPYVIAVDCPSGLDCDTGVIDANALPADETITFIAPKAGLLRFPAAERVGRLHVTTLGIPDDAPSLRAAKSFLVDGSYLHEHLPPRPPDSHKGTYGKALVVGGSAQYIGAPGLAASAAYRAGAGLVTTAASQDVVNALAGAMPGVTWLPLTGEGESDAALLARTAADYEAVLVGPGMGGGAQADMMMETLLQTLVSPMAQLVIDADGLNWLAARPNWHTRLPPNTVLTPHPGEMARLAGMETAAVQADRIALAREKASAWYCVLVLKGAHTVIADPEGNVAVLPFKNSALATAGTGDVLAGAICGLLAQRMKPFEAAVCAGYLHGLAGERAAAHYGAWAVTVGDVLYFLH